MELTKLYEILLDENEVFSILLSRQTLKIKQ